MEAFTRLRVLDERDIGRWLVPVLVCWAIHEVRCRNEEWCIDLKRINVEIAIQAGLSWCTGSLVGIAKSNRAGLAGYTRTAHPIPTGNPGAKLTMELILPTAAMIWPMTGVVRPAPGRFSNVRREVHRWS